MKRELTKKQVLSFFFGFCLFSIVVIVLTFVNLILHTGKRELYIGYAPFSALIKIDDQTFRNNTKSWVSLGKHHILVSLDNFEAYEATINITEETDAIYGLLNPTNSQGEKIKESHLSDYQKIEGYYGADANTKGEKEKSTYPILNSLPYKNSLYSLGYISENSRPIITISTSEPYLDEAIIKLKSLSDNLENYELQIKSPSNPFENIPKSPSSLTDPTDFILETYKNLNQVFNVYSGKTEGDYYYTKITTGSTSTYNLITYKIILKKSGDSYEILSDHPSPLTNIYNTKNTPEDILKQANNL